MGTKTRYKELSEWFYIMNNLENLNEIPVSLRDNFAIKALCMLSNFSNQMNALLDEVLMLEKFPGKGGWTFVRLPEIKTTSGKPLGWDKVRALFDDHEVSEIGLLSLGNGQRFLPVKAEIRKSISKQAGDQVRLQLFARVKELDIKTEFLLCLEDEPEALSHFQNWKAVEREKYISWIEHGQSTEQQVERMAKAVDRIAAGLFFIS